MSVFDQAGWYLAHTLAERISPSPSSSLGAVSLNATSTSAASEWMAYWRSQSHFDQEGLFGQRLAASGLSENEFLSLLAEPAETLKRRSAKPEWLIQVESGLSSRQTQYELLPAALRDIESAPFLVGLGSWMRYSRHKLRQGIDSLAQIHGPGPIDPITAENLLYLDLSKRLAAMVSRTMVLELNVCRLKGLLKGETAEDRFASFCERLQQPQVMLDLLYEYPVLARNVMEAMQHWLTASLEFLSHLHSDWDAISCTFFGGAKHFTLSELQSGIGDPHRGGRTVRKAVFNSGERLIYKPRSLAVELHFQELLKWLNDRLPELQFRTLSVLDVGDHGWVEFVEPRPCTSTEEVRRFYERQGGYLALLYALNAVDCHYGNLIASGEHPVLIDLESVFHPSFDISGAGGPQSMSGRLFDQSVLRTGLLPQKMWSADNHAGIDLSGLGATPGQEFPLPSPGWERPGTDEMHFVRKQQVLSAVQNRPSLQGQEICVSDYQDAIEGGFCRMYRFLSTHRNELLEAGGPISSFGADPLRVLLRATQTYGTLLTEGFHPDVLRDALDRDCLFDRLWLEAAKFPWLAQCISSEVVQLHAGDIPLFTTSANSLDVRSSTGTTFTGFWRQTPLEAVQEKVQGLSERGLEQQLWFLRASLATVNLISSTPVKVCDNVPKPAALLPLRELHGRLVSGAVAIGDRLEALALQSEQDLVWVGLNQTNNGGWELDLSALDLYNGLPGIALFLAYLAQVTGEARFSRLARTAVHGILTLARQKPQLLRQIGFFDGISGIIYMLSHLHVLWKEPELLEEADRLLDTVSSLIERDDYFDIIYGSAGCIGGLLSLHQCSPSDKIIRLMRRCGEHLISQAIPMPEGIGWRGRFPATQPLTGFSHGAAGISWALMELAYRTGEESFRNAALSGIAYERSVYSRKHGNWPDFRSGPDGSSTSTNGEIHCEVKWCNGAPGIGLARLNMMRRVQDAVGRQEIDVAIKTTLENGFGLSHSLCHGDLGNIEILIQADQLLQLPSVAPHLDRAANIVLESINQRGWITGIVRGVETPGLMVGIAGIGYGLLRLACPQVVPSVLTLDLPVLNSHKMQSYN